MANGNRNNRQPTAEDPLNENRGYRLHIDTSGAAMSAAGAALASIGTYLIAKAVLKETPGSSVAANVLRDRAAYFLSGAAAIPGAIIGNLVDDAIDKTRTGEKQPLVGYQQQVSPFVMDEGQIYARQTGQNLNYAPSFSGSTQYQAPVRSAQPQTQQTVYVVPEPPYQQQPQTYQQPYQGFRQGAPSQDMVENAMTAAGQQPRMTEASATPRQTGSESPVMNVKALQQQYRDYLQSQDLGRS